MSKENENKKKNEAPENKNGFWVGGSMPLRIKFLKLRMKILSSNHATNHQNAQKTT